MTQTSLNIDVSEESKFFWCCDLLRLFQAIFNQCVGRPNVRRPFQVF